jgi:ribosomal protein L24
METALAESLLEISQKMHEDTRIKTYHVHYLPHRIYIEAPRFLKIQDLMKFSVYGHLVSRAACILDDINRKFLHSTSAPDVPCSGSWVRIIQPGIYRGDLAVVLLTPSEPLDIVLIAVIPRFSVSKNKKRKKNRPAPALLDPKFVANFPSNESNFHLIGSRTFHPNGLEILRAPSIHALKIEPRPSEAELSLFQLSFGKLADVTCGTEDIIQSAVIRAFHNKSRRLWRTGDRVRILEGSFMDMSCSIHEIDELNRTVIVEFESPNPTPVEVNLTDLERQFFVGDQVRVALGNNKGKTGSILKINDSVGIIVEGTANQLVEVTPPSILICLLIILPSLKSCCCILRAITWPLLSPPLLIQLLRR